eukprot:1140586-Prymnesium_polylepis.1
MPSALPGMPCRSRRLQRRSTPRASSRSPLVCWLAPAASFVCLLLLSSTCGAPCGLQRRQTSLAGGQRGPRP